MSSGFSKKYLIPVHLLFEAFLAEVDEHYQRMSITMYLVWPQAHRQVSVWSLPSLQTWPLRFSWHTPHSLPQIRVEGFADDISEEPTKTTDSGRNVAGFFGWQLPQRPFMRNFAGRWHFGQRFIAQHFSRWVYFGQCVWRAFVRGCKSCSCRYGSCCLTLWSSSMNGYVASCPSLLNSIFWL